MVSDNSKLRDIVMKAGDQGVITKEEVGFIVTLVERFRRDIEVKTEQVYMLTGEISQLRANEKIIIDLVDNLIRASDRDKARQETIKELKENTPANKR